jgi:hypothetical protein
MEHVTHVATTNPDGTITTVSKTAGKPYMDNVSTHLPDDWKLIFARYPHPGRIATVVVTLDGKQVIGPDV